MRILGRGAGCALLVLSLGAVGCDEGDSSGVDAAMSAEGAGGAGGPGGMGGMGGMPPPDGMGGAGGMPPPGGMGGMMGPPACEDASDCEGACPMFPLGCICAPVRDGLGCIAACAETADCPEMNRAGEAMECRDGACVPEGAGMGGMGGMPPPDGMGGMGGMPPPDGMGGMGGMPPPDGMGGGMAPPPCEDEEDCVEGCPEGSAGCTCAMTRDGMGCIPTCADDGDCPREDMVCAQGLCRPNRMMTPDAP